jgi:hypothetical protein
VSLLLPPAGDNPRAVATAVNQALKGKINAVGSVTLAASATATVMVDPLVGTASLIVLFPQTAHAAAELGNGTAWIAPSDYVSGVSFKINHTSNSQTDRVFGYCILG